MGLPIASCNSREVQHYLQCAAENDAKLSSHRSNEVLVFNGKLFLNLLHRSGQCLGY
jgi:hypothetical protein